MSLSTTADPFALFDTWLDEAKAHPGIADHTAMSLATADAEGNPDVRMVLLKAHGPEGFVFYTNLTSVKGQQLAARPYAALCFYWMPLERQVRIRGPVTPVSATEADAYFQSRPRDSRIGAWASKQSQPLEGRFELERRVAKYALKYPLGEVPRPEFWSGFRLQPERMEFWQAHTFRLHERIEFRPSGGAWTGQFLFP